MIVNELKKHWPLKLYAIFRSYVKNIGLGMTANTVSHLCRQGAWNTSVVYEPTKIKTQEASCEFPEHFP